MEHPPLDSSRKRARSGRFVARALLGSFFLFGGIAMSCGQLFSDGASTGVVNIDGLSEASGIAASRNNESVLWTHNDAGGGPRIFALDTRGRHLGDYDMSKVTKLDYEDIAIGPGPIPNVSYIYVGDIGDNNSSRSNIKVYQIPEPAVYTNQAAKPLSMDLKGVRQLVLSYPDGAHNAETLLVDPVTGDLFIGTKEPDICRFYGASKAQMDSMSNITLSYVCQIPFNLASGGDISPSGSEIIVRQEEFASLWRRGPGQSVAEAFGGTPVAIPVVGSPEEPNGEAVGFDALGGGYYTLSDSTDTQPLYYFKRIGAGGLQPPITLVPAGGDWRYLDTGADAGVAWRQPGYVDAAWKTGFGQFGYGNGDERTVVSYGSSKKKKFITTYFRKTFSVTNLARIQSVELKLLFDDGVAVYLNGSPIARRNLAADAAFDTLATAEQDDLENTWFTIPVDVKLLFEGANTLAAEVHQEAANSPDLGFDAQLLAYENTKPIIVSADHDSSGAFTLKVMAGNASYTVETSTNLTDWSAAGVVKVTNGIGEFTHRPTVTDSLRFYRVTP